MDHITNLNQMAFLLNISHQNQSLGATDRKLLFLLHPPLLCTVYISSHPRPCYTVAHTLKYDHFNTKMYAGRVPPHS